MNFNNQYKDLLIKLHVSSCKYYCTSIRMDLLLRLVFKFLRTNNIEFP